MECAGKGSGTRCVGPPTRRCGRCGAVSYCSVTHQVSHWSVHKEECERLEEQMERAKLLKEFPFTFSREATVEVCEKRETRCSFLAKRGVHRVGMWMFECSCGASVDLSDLSRFLTLTSVNVICEQPLTLYHAIRLVAARNLIPEFSNELYVHYLGPDKELAQLAVFGELNSLFPGLQVHVELVGPAIPGSRSVAYPFILILSVITACCMCQSAGWLLVKANPSRP
ncbi:hypothetical protein RHGRI_033575 [Rhododendron griersonianum]|uniref:MYND-type domain-containing protein n=1 Tax=Rhododendron griersonianum TaxID=479676 RepID=A0AAV6HXU5_9ERIC|nr:hypothetical protein RHGRI_033575 [Rhododendron griersonianum]